MKEVIRKTEKERKLEEENNLLTIKVSDEHYFYFACEKCGLAYFGEDLVDRVLTGGIKCRNLIKKHWWSNKKSACGENIYGGDEKSFNKFYKLKVLSR